MKATDPYTRENGELEKERGGGGRERGEREREKRKSDRRERASERASKRETQRETERDRDTQRETEIICGPGLWWRHQDGAGEVTTRVSSLFTASNLLFYADFTALRPEGPCLFSHHAAVFLIRVPGVPDDAARAPKHSP